MRFCGAGEVMSAVLRKGAGMVRVRFADAGAGAVMVRVEIFAHFGQWIKLQNNQNIACFIHILGTKKLLWRLVILKTV